MYKFSEANAIRKERSGDCSQKETCLKFRPSHLGHWLVVFLSSRQSQDAAVFV